MRANRYHALGSAPTGILFRERDDIPTAHNDWQGINNGQYPTGGRLDDRQGYPLFLTMVDELRIAIADGVRIYTDEPGLYYRMLVSGIHHIQQTFSWDQASQEYVRYLI